MSIMSNLPNDIIIHILKERRIMKQADKYKKNYNYVLREIKTLDKLVFRNLIKYCYEKWWDTGKKILEQIKLKNDILSDKKRNLIYELDEIFDFPFDNSSVMLDYINLEYSGFSGYEPVIFVESSDEDN